MEVMILAAGRGTRLGELGRTLPKALVPIGGEPLLARQLAYLASEGAERVLINAHHLAEQIFEFVARQTTPLEVEVSFEPELLGTAGGVRAALAGFDRAAPIVVLHADTVVEVSLRTIVAEHVAMGAEGTICVNWLEQTQGKGLVEVDEHDMVVRFVEKPADAPPGLANAGIYVLDPQLLDLAPDNQFYDFGLDLFPQALRLGRPLRARLLDDLAHDIGTPETLAQAQEAVG
jgi:mannose-1-phosphate guanylyltransferase